jgi:concanavalin A-like lectin/glucanase superfamily protein
MSSHAANTTEISANGSGVLANPGPATWALCVKRTTSHDEAFLHKGDGNSSAGWWLDMNVGNNDFCLTIVRGSNNMDQCSEWAHIAATWDGTLTDGSGVHLYINGAEVPKDGASDTASGTHASDAAERLYISRDDGGVAGQFTGLMDDVRVYNRVLSADDIKRLYNIGSTLTFGAPNSSGSLSQGLVGYWSFNGGDIAIDNTGGMRAYDRSGFGNHSARSSAANAPARIPGRLGQALDYVGDSSDTIEINPASSINDMAQVSGSLWLYTRDTLDFNSILNKWSDNTNLDGWGLEDCGCGTDNLGFEAGFNTNSFFIETTNAPIKRDRWQHIAFTWGGAGDGSDFRFYVDGVLVTSTNLVSTGSNGRSSDAARDLHIGSNDSGGSGWDGSIDEVRVYNRVLSADEIKRLYNLGGTMHVGVAPVSGTLAQGLVAYWPLDGADTSMNASGIMLQQDESGSTIRRLQHWEGPVRPQRSSEERSAKDFNLTA